MIEPPNKRLAPAKTFPPARASSRERELPKASELVDYNYAVAGHAGTMCDADGELFIKPCTQSEITFYDSARFHHQEFYEWMPLYYGNLTLTENTTEEMIHAAIPDIVANADVPTPIKEEVQSHLHLESRQPVTVTPVLQRAATDGIKWIPNNTRKIKTDRAVVLSNASYGFKKPNIMDAKLGLRLWADDAPEEKKNRFDEIARETTHMKYGFRVAGMRVYQGASDPKELDEEGFKVYDKWWGRKTVSNDNILEMMKKFIFNEAAGIDEELGKLVAQIFATDLRRVQEVLEAEESRMYSSSLLFVFEGDGKALRAAMEEVSDAGRMAEAEDGQETDGIGMGDDDMNSTGLEAMVCEGASQVSFQPGGFAQVSFKPEQLAEVEDDFTDFSSEPRIYSLKLIDFAHARFVPGQGPDENILLGVRSLAKLFEDMTI